MVFMGTVGFRQPDHVGLHPTGRPPALEQALFGAGADQGPQVAELKASVPGAVNALARAEELLGEAVELAV